MKENSEKIDRNSRQITDLFPAVMNKNIKVLPRISLWYFNRFCSSRVLIPPGLSQIHQPHPDNSV